MKKNLFVVFSVIFLLISPSAFARGDFYDDFGDLDFNKNWEIFYISPEEGDALWETYGWRTADDRFGAFLGSSQMRTHAVLRNGNFSNYIYSLELIGRQGEDKNILFRYKDKNNWYGFHMNNAGTFFGIKRDGVYSDTRVSNFSFKNNVNYNVEIVLVDDLVSLIVDGNRLVDNYKISENFISSGSIALKVSAGGNPSSEVYFDNVRVTKINTPVVLIPGHGASFSFKEMFMLFNWNDPADSMIGGWQKKLV